MRNLIAVALTSVALYACSSTPAVPTVDSVNFPTFTADAAGNHAATGTIAAHSPNGNITQLQIHFPTQNGITLADGMPLSTVGFTSPFGVTLQFPPAVPVGTYSLQVTATDATGVASSPFPTTITLQ